MPDFPKLFFNSSLPRSGSTLLQNILAQNPRFHCSPTSGVLELLLAARNTYAGAAPEFRSQDPKVTKPGFISFCRYGVLGYYAGITERPVCVDKSRGWLNYYQWIAECFPRPKMLVCVRDLRSILSSMEKLWRKNKHRGDPLDTPSKLNMLTTANRVTHWINAQPVGVSVLILLDAIHTGVIKNCHVVKFEELTTSPAKVMRGVYDYLEEEPFEHDFQNVQQLTHEDDGQFAIYGDHQVREQVKPVPLDYDQVLGRDVAEHVKRANPVFYSTFYPNTR